MDTLRNEIADVAARLVIEEGQEYGAAKRCAVQQLGLPGRTALPDNDLLDDAVRAHIALFCSDTQPVELRALRELALPWMERLAAFRPHLTGAVWRGTATRRSDIYLQLFCDDSKSAEIALIDKGVKFKASVIQGFTGKPVDALSVRLQCHALATYVGLHLIIYDFDDLRGALKPDGRGHTERGDVRFLRKILNEAAL